MSIKPKIQDSHAEFLAEERFPTDCLQTGFLGRNRKGVLGAASSPSLALCKLMCPWANGTRACVISGVRCSSDPAELGSLWGLRSRSEGHARKVTVFQGQA